MKMPKKSFIKIFLLITTISILILLASILFLRGSTSPGYLELYDVKDERVGIVHCKICYLRWHGRKTELAFLLYKRTRVAGYSVPGYVSVKWNQTNGNVVSVKDHAVCAAKDGDVFTLSIPIFAAYVQITYDNKTVRVSGTTGEMQETSLP